MIQQFIDRIYIIYIYISDILYQISDIRYHDSRRPPAARLPLKS